MECQFDGLVGLTHNYAGLSYGNVASLKSSEQNSSPREAALQGLEKMYTLYKMGMAQALIPPQERPHLEILRQLGWSAKTDQELLVKAYKAHPDWVATCFSASWMGIMSWLISFSLPPDGE